MMAKWKENWGEIFDNRLSALEDKVKELEARPVGLTLEEQLELNKGLQKIHLDTIARITGKGV